MTVSRTDFIGGVALSVGGLLVSLQAMDYGLGTLRTIGPGLFPFAAGTVLTILGLLLLLSSLRGGSGAGEPRPPIRWWAAASVFGGLVAWAIVTPRFGLVPGTTALVLIASFAAGRPRPAMMLGLIVVLCGGGVLLFVEALGLPLPILKL